MLIEWNDSLMVGYPPMDSEHKSLIALINLLHESVRAGSNREVIEDALFSLADHVAAHFNHENEMMMASNYPERREHLQEHRILIDEFDTVLDQIDLLSDQQLYDAMEFVRSWFTGHVTTGDARLGKYLSQLPAAAAGVSPDR